MRVFSSIFISLFILALSPCVSHSQSLTVDQSFILEECCTLGSYDKGDVSQFVLKSPINFVVEDFSQTMNKDESEDINRFMQKIAQATSSLINANAPPNGNIPFSSKLGIMIMPLKRSDLTPFDWTSLKDQFEFMQNSTIPESTEKGISGLVAKMYSTDDDIIGRVRGTAVGGIDYAVMFIKPKSSEDLLAMIKKGILEGMGYNVDNHKIEGTIFSADNKGYLTADDEIVLRELYKRNK